MATLPQSRAASGCIVAALMALAVPGCEVFRELGTNLEFMERTGIVTGRITNAGDYPRVYAVVADWDAAEEVVKAADFANVSDLGLFGFFVESRYDQALAAFSDRNGNQRYDPGEPAWYHSGPDGEPAPLKFDSEGKARVEGALSADTRIPQRMVDEVRRFTGGRSAAEIARGWDIPVALGDLADLDEPKFAAERGQEGLWQPARFPMESGIGIYFLEKYDPDRTPVLFIYGAAGSPQDWRTFFDEFDRRRYQIWFAFYPTGRRLDEMAGSLNRGVTLLHNQLGFRRLDVVAHSMGGLLARGFVIKNVIEDDNTYIRRLVTISTPWGGHEAAAMGVRRAPEVVPSWRDMEQGSDYQKQIFRDHLKGKVDFLLLYGHKSSRSMLLPKENDGTVSVASELAEPAVEDAVKVIGYDEDHVSILSNPDVIRTVERFLGGGIP